MVMHGLKMFDQNKIKSFFDFQNEDIKFAANDAIENFKKWEKDQQFVSHRQALEIIMNRSHVQKIEFGNEQ
jgi:hypothetical protein